MRKICIQVPINNVSFGQLGTLILRNLKEREQSLDLDVYVSPIGGVDLSAQNIDDDFKKWLNDKILKFTHSYTRDIKVFKLWHLSDCVSSPSKEIQTTLSFMELDSLTKAEINAAKNTKLLFTSQFTVDLFKSFGCDNVHYLPPVFDHYNFNRIDKKYHADSSRIVMNLCGKIEKRKHTKKIIQTWIKRFGHQNNRVLQCCIYNPFLVRQTPQGMVDFNNQAIAECLEGKEKPYNVVFYPHFGLNSQYNDFLNSSNIILGLSGGENIGLPEMQSVAVGKASVILNANGYKSWITPENSVIVNPDGKEDASDGIFFQKDGMYNSGNIFTWNQDAAIAGMEQAIKRVEANPLNTAGLELQERFNANKFVDNILRLTLE